MSNIKAYTASLLLLVFGLCASAQETPALELPKTGYQSFGFKKPVKQVAIAYYKSDEKGYEPAMLEVYTFNDGRQIVQKYIRIYGKYGSETAHNYVYANGVLDSIDTLASAQNFSRQEKMHYDENGKLAKVTATGAYVNYAETYAYDDSGAVASITRQRQNGTALQAQFNRAKNYVSQKETAADGKVTESVFVYDGDQLFASFVAGQPTVTFYDAYHRSDFTTQIEADVLAYALKLRDLKRDDFETFKKQISELQGQPQSVAIFDIPIEVTNMAGDWIKRLQVDKRFGNAEKRMVFKKLIYADGSESGSTDFDLIFQSKVSKF